MVDLTRILYRLSCLPDFKITGTFGGFIVEADGVKFDATCLPVDEGLQEALIYIEAYRTARAMVKQAKVVLDPGASK